MFSHTERDNLSDTFKKVEEYPWSINEVTVPVTMPATEFIKLAIIHGTSINLSKFFGCSSATVARRASEFTEIDNSNKDLKNKILDVFNIRFCTHCGNTISKEESVNNFCRCEACRKEKNNKWGRENKEWRKEYEKQYYKENKEKINDRHRNYYVENKDKVLKRQKKHYEENKQSILARKNIQRVNRLKRMPKWADKYEIGLIYADCPEGFHVDHIIPLQGEKVSGLHVPENLQYLPAKENLKKSNFFDLEKFNS